MPDVAPNPENLPPATSGTAAPYAGNVAAAGSDREIASASQWTLIRRRFAKHRLASSSLWLLVVLYLLAAGAEFFAPHSQQWRDLTHTYCPPQVPHFSFTRGFYAPAMALSIDPVTFKKTYIEDDAQLVP